MRKWVIRAIAALLCGLIVAGFVLPTFAAATENEITGNYSGPVNRIRTVEDLMAMAEDPTADYVLEADLDLAGVEWKPVDFSGIFEGNGHAILNLTLSQPGDAKSPAYDGNRKDYECSYVGLFGTLENASVSNLKLLNVRGVVEADYPCFMGGLAGCSIDSTISGCTVSGTLELRAYNQIFGLAGVVGYGSGYIDSCDVDVTLICTDTDETTKDEQFLGGVYSTGFMDVTNSTINIDGYASEHGYAHNGGIVGMLMQYPIGAGRTARITGNTVSGKITFFENNLDRRAYCDVFAGEVLAVSYGIYENLRYFTRDERFQYDQELRPEMCENPTYTETVTEPGCDTYGYTTYTCDSCGYTYTDNYTLFVHAVQDWTVLQEATVKSEGKSTGPCILCGLELERTDPKLDPAQIETQPPKPTETLPPEPVVEEQRIDPLFPAIVLGTIALTVLAVYAARQEKKKE